MKDIQKALILAPHPDDGEFSCGGTIRKLTEQGVDLYYAVFSPCKISVPEGFPEDILYKELPNAVAHLGIQEENIFKYDFPVRRLNENRQDILEEMVKLRKELNPDLVLLPNSTDIHQDHATIHMEGIRAFKHTRIIGYELPWNNYNVTNNFHVELEESHLEAKIAAIKEYKSQEFRSYSQREFFYGLATVRGLQVNHRYAESFELIRWLM